MRTKLNAQKFGIHFVICFGFLLLPFLSSPRSSVFDSFNFGQPEMQGLFNSGLLIVFFYFNYYYVIPRFYHQKKYLLWIAITLLAFAIILLLPRIFIPDFHPVQNFHPDRNLFPHKQQPFHENSIFRQFRFEETLTKFLVVFVLSLLLRTRELWKKSQQEKKQAELSYLKSQVNPHFLFNTLNGIYSLALDKSEKTPDAIVKLSELMRYVISDISKNLVPIQDEIQHLLNYIELQKLRLGETVEIKFNVTGVITEQQIAPLLLIPFVENAFKYGIHPESTSKINIQLDINEDKMEFMVKNRIETASGFFVQNGTGLDNVKRRLALIYPGNFNLTIRDNDQNYTVILTLKLIQ
ncbi:MAG: sensor histidine kinase [Paludibacter sp.]